MKRRHLAQRIQFESKTWTFLAFGLALLEGGVIGILLKNAFAEQVEVWLLNFCVALATGAPFYTNLFSFTWVNWSRGRNKARVVSNLATICCFCCILISFVPVNLFGLIMLLGLLILARACWSGVLTVRSTIWRANYPRYIRGKVAARLATLTSLFMSVASACTGAILEWQFEAFRALYLLFGLISLAGAIRYRNLSIRHHDKELVKEQKEPRKVSFLRMFAILKENRAFGRYMLAMFVLGTGNLMFMAPLIVYLNEHTEVSKVSQVMVTTAIPLSLIPFAVGWWAKLLDQNHVFHFRAIHGWGFVVAIGCFFSAQLSGVNGLLLLGAGFYGIAISGGVIGWNLGHNDFVGKASPMEYMAVHVTLTGIRGLFAPLVGISFYQYLESVNFGLGKFALALPLSISLSGAIMFVWFNHLRKLGRL